MNRYRSGLTGRLTDEHRQLDDLFGRFLAALEARDAAAAHRSIGEFDELLRGHTALEEERVFRAHTWSLAPGEGEDVRARLYRELRLEHVQIREVSAMILHLLADTRDLEGARRLAPNLARRWDAHATREERDVFPTFPSTS